MHIELNAPGRRRSGARLLAAACLLLLTAVAASAQEAATVSAPEQEFTVSDLLKLPGKVVAQGKNTTPKGLLKLRTYRVEEVELPRVAEVEVRGRKATVAKAFRVTITGGPFPVRALPAVIWIDDEALGYGIESEDLSEITVVTYDEAALKDGAAIQLSYGDKESKEGRTKLPETLKLDTKGVSQ